MRKIFTLAALCCSLMSLGQSGMHFIGGAGSDYINIGQSPSLNLTEEFTIEGWFKHESGSGPIIFNGGGWGPHGYTVYCEPSRIRTEMRNGSGTVIVEAPQTSGTWQHFATTFSLSTGKHIMYLNGVKTDEVAVSQALGTNTGDAIIGAYLGGSQSHYHGSIDELRIWNRALCPSEIMNNMYCQLNGSENGLVASYSFEDGVANGDNSSVSTVADSTGTNNGTLVNFTKSGTTSNFIDASDNAAIGYCQPYLPAQYEAWEEICQGEEFSFGSQTLTETGEYNETFTSSGGCDSAVTLYLTVSTTGPCAVNNAINFDGSLGDNIDVGSSLNVTDALTFEAWVKLANNGNHKTLIWNSGTFGDSKGYGIHVNSGTTLNVTIGGVNAANPISINDTWTHIAATWDKDIDGGAIKVYLNGTLLSGTANNPNSIVTYSGNAYIGSYPHGSTIPFYGDLDEVRVWNRALCSDEIEAHMNCQLEGVEQGLLAYYDFNQGVAERDNTGISIIEDRTNNTTATLNGFIKNGSTSNFVDASSNGIAEACAPYSPYSNTFLKYLCAGEEFEFGTQTITEGGEYTEVFKNAGGCDSVITLNVFDVAPIDTSESYVEICKGGFYVLDTDTIRESGVYYHTWMGKWGCDSTVEYTINIGDLNHPVAFLTPEMDVCTPGLVEADLAFLSDKVSYSLFKDGEEINLEVTNESTPTISLGEVMDTSVFELYGKREYWGLDTGFGSALTFNGSQYLANDILPALKNSFTIEAWVNPSSTHQIDGQSSTGTGGTAGQKYVLWPTHRGNDAGVGISVGTNGVSVYEHGAGFMPAVVVWEGAVEGWTHIAVVYNERVAFLYVNGNLVKTGSVSVKANVYVSLGDNDAFYPNSGGIGGGSYGSFQGEIDQFRIWDRALADYEVSSYKNECPIGSTPNLYASYDFNEGTGGVANDATSNAYHLNLTNMDNSSSWVTGLGCGAVTCFEGSAGEIQVNVVLDPSTELVGNTIFAVEGYNYQWIDCSTNQLLDGEVSNEYTVSGSGDYAAEITKGSCTDTTECVNVIITAMSDNNEMGLSIFPNPAQDIVIISNLPNGTSDVTIIDINGVIVNEFSTENQSTLQLRVNELKSGVHFLTISNAHGSNTYKMVVD